MFYYLSQKKQTKMQILHTHPERQVTFGKQKDKKKSKNENLLHSQERTSCIAKIICLVTDPILIMHIDTACKESFLEVLLVCKNLLLQTFWDF